MIDEVLDAIDGASIGVFACFKGNGSPIAVPVTPYIDRDRGVIVITSTLAYIRKEEMVRRDGRVALVAGGIHVVGDARVTADVSGDVFVERYLEQELRKFPPAQQLVKVPDYRNVLAFYFGRAIMYVEPVAADASPGEDACTAITTGGNGYPRIDVLSPTADPDSVRFPVRGREGQVGAASVLFHRESADYSDLRWLRLEGEVRDGVFSQTGRRIGTLDAPWVGSPDAALEARARAVMKEWEQA